MATRGPSASASYRGWPSSADSPAPGRVPAARVEAGSGSEGPAAFTVGAVRARACWRDPADERGGLWIAALAPSVEQRDPERPGV